MNYISGTFSERRKRLRELAIEASKTRCHDLSRIAAWLDCKFPEHKPHMVECALHMSRDGEKDVASTKVTSLSNNHPHERTRSELREMATTALTGMGYMVDFRPGCDLVSSDERGFASDLTAHERMAAIFEIATFFPSRSGRTTSSEQ